MPRTHRKESQKTITRDKVDKDVFAATESMGITDRGITDRKLLEKFTEQVSKCLEVTHPFSSTLKCEATKRKSYTGDHQNGKK